MKVQCPKCSTAYRLPDDRVPAGGGKLKVRCKHCGFVIDVANEPSGESETKAVKWFVAVGNDRRGPMPADGVLSLIKAGEVGAETFAWRKGFQEWTRLGDLPEFQAELAPTTEDVEETQLMDLKDIQKVTGAQAAVTPETDTAEAQPDDPGFDTAADASEATTEEESQSGMVWQRRETSVLFSLDDYKTRKKTKQTGALTASSQLEMKPIDDVGGAAAAPVSTRKTTGVISLDESQVKLMADKMSKRAFRRKAIAGAVAGVVGLVAVVAAGYWFMTRPPAPVEQPAPKPAIASKQAVKEVAPAPKPEVKPAPAPVAEKPATPAAEAAPTAEKAPAAAGKGKSAVARKKARKKGTKGKKPAKKKAAAKKPAKVEKPPEPKPTPSPKATDDVNALLAQYKAGKQGGKPGSTGGTPKSKAGAGSNLPAQLTMGQIQSVLRKQTRAVKKCVRSAGAPKGTMVKARTRIVIAGSGRVVSATVSNAAGAEGCIRSKLSKLKFPRFKGANMVVPYPFSVVP